LTLTFNDSAPQVDHFDYHAGLGCPDFLLLLVKKQDAKPRIGQTEHLARKALALCPELQTLDWQWKSEKYRGGHGNYLMSSLIALPAAVKQSLTVRKTFGNGGPDAVSWEIRFATPWRGTAMQLWPHRHYGSHPPENDFSNGRHEDTARNSGCNAVTAAWCLNERFRGVEIHFTRRPDDATLAPLRADRAWNYTGRTKCWYARQTDATIAWAKAFCEQFNAPRTAGIQPAGSTAVVPWSEVNSPALPPVVPSSIVSSPIVPRLPAEASQRRLERKIIHFTDADTDTGHEGIGSSRGIVREYNPAVGTWTPVTEPPAATESASVPCVPSVPSPSVITTRPVPAPA